MKEIRCNWCGREHAQPAQSAAEALKHCLREATTVERLRAQLRALTPEERVAMRRWAIRHLGSV